MTKKLVLLACVVALALSAGAQNVTTTSKGPWMNAPKSHAVGGEFKAALETASSKGPWMNAPKSHAVGGEFNSASIASPADLTSKFGPSAPLGGSKGGRVGRK
jgi:hypothetical protein